MQSSIRNKTTLRSAKAKNTANISAENTGKIVSADEQDNCTPSSFISAGSLESLEGLFRDTIGTNLALGMGVGFADEMNDVAEDMQAAVPIALDGSTVNVGGVVDGNSAGSAAVAFGGASGPLITIQRMIVRSGGWLIPAPPLH